MHKRMLPDRGIFHFALGHCLIVGFCLSAITNPASAQFDGLIEEPADPELKISARYHIESGTDTGYLIVRLEVPEGSHIYSMTQPKPLKPSKIVVAQSEAFMSDKVFKSDVQPNVIEDDPLFHARVEKFAGTVQFYVPIKIDTSTDPKKLKPMVTWSGQVCSEDGYCMLVDKLTTRADFAGFFQREAKNPAPPLPVRK